MKTVKIRLRENHSKAGIYFTVEIKSLWGWKTLWDDKTFILPKIFTKLETVIWFLREMYYKDPQLIIIQYPSIIRHLPK